MSTTPKPPLSRRDLSLLEAHAGLQARDAATSQGGDPAQVAALMHAATSEAPGPGESQFTVGGVSLSGMTLAVTLAVTALRSAYAPLPTQPAEALTMARMAFLFHNPYKAYELLSPVPDLAALDAEALDLVGEWGVVESLAFGAHVTACQTRNPSAAANPEDDAPLGKSKTGKTTLKRPARPGLRA